MVANCWLCSGSREGRGCVGCCATIGGDGAALEITRKQALNAFSRGSTDLIREGICGRGRVIGVESEPVTVATGDGGKFMGCLGFPGVNALAWQRSW